MIQVSADRTVWLGCWACGSKSLEKKVGAILRGLDFQVREICFQSVVSWELLKRNRSGQHVLRKKQTLAWSVWCSEGRTKQGEEKELV